MTVTNDAPSGAAAPAAAPAQTTIPLSSEAALFQRRWQQECDTALLLAAENGKLRSANAGLSAELKTLGEKYQAMIEKLEAAGQAAGE